MNRESTMNQPSLTSLNQCLPLLTINHYQATHALVPYGLQLTGSFSPQGSGVPAPTMTFLSDISEHLGESGRRRQTGGCNDFLHQMFSL